MIRCTTCGRRLNDRDGSSAAVCPAHGAQALAPEPIEEKVPFVVAPPDLPIFRVRKTLGQGGFGAVFLAERISDGQLVAIKVARADNASAGESLMREAYALSAIGPPHVPAVYEKGLLNDGAAYVVMEFVKAPLLTGRLTGRAAPLS